jgi:hypothetical protein
MRSLLDTEIRRQREGGGEGACESNTGSLYSTNFKVGPNCTPSGTPGILGRKRRQRTPDSAPILPRLLLSPQFPRTQFDCIDAEMLLSAVFMNDNFPVRVTLTPQDSALLTRLGQVNRLRANAYSSKLLNNPHEGDETPVTLHLLGGIAQSECQLRR